MLDKIVCSLTVNGVQYSVTVDANTTLAELLREHIGLKGTKLGCNRGECGACTVLLNGKTVYSCMVLAADAVGCNILTVEGLTRDGQLHPLQRLFIEHDALQCGYCTPGFLMSLMGLFIEEEEVDLEKIKQAIAGVVCRCGAYPNVIKAALEYARTKSGWR